MSSWQHVYSEIGRLFLFIICSYCILIQKGRLDLCILHLDRYIWHLDLSLFILSLSVEETDVEDDAGKILKEVYVQPVAPLEFHAGYRLASEDPAIFSDGGEDDRDGWICRRVWPQVPILMRAPSSSTRRPATTSTGVEAPCDSPHNKLKRDLLQQHHNLVNLLTTLNVDACKEHRLHNASAVLSRVKDGNKTCTICRRVCSTTQLLKTHIRGQHLKDPTLKCSQCDFVAGDKYGLKVHLATHQSSSKFQCSQCPRSYNTKGHLNQHQKEHQGRFGPCPHCRTTFAQKSGLVKHVPRCSRQQGGAPEKEFVCDICDRKYSRKGELMRHMHSKHK